MRYWLPLAMLAMAVGAGAQTSEPATPIGTAKGTVFQDTNRNGKRDPGERGLGGIAVSNQLDVVKTDHNGNWRLPYTDDTIFFVVKPRGYAPLRGPQNRNRFFYIHRPAGSRSDLRYSGVKPTGPLPASIDFALIPSKESDRFSALFFGDSQTRNLREVGYFARDIVEPIIASGEKFAFGVTLGDIVYDDLSVTEPLVQATGLIGSPWHYVLGNHDENYDAKDDKESNDHFEASFGPSYYSFEYGATHFVVLDDVVWTGKENAQKLDPKRTGGFYQAGLGPKQLKWLGNDLAQVPKSKLVVLMMHIPIMEIREKQDLYKLLAQRPNTLSVSAHTHTMEHVFLDAKQGWPAAKPHHHVINVTTCGSWWGGLPDERGIPDATMGDGAPNGYSVFTFDGNRYSIEFRAASRPKSYQMNIIAPETVRSGETRGTDVLANVFGGSEKSRVEIKVGIGPWRDMKYVPMVDPSYAALVDRVNKEVKAPYNRLAGPARSTHIWRSVVIQRLKPGTYPIAVRATDVFGHVYTSTRMLRVE